MKHVKKLLALLLTLAMVLPLLPAIPVHAATITSYKLNDKIEFGWYPQSRVTDDAVIAALNAKVTSVDWKSYGYYTGTGKEGTMTPGDWMKYCDVMINDVGYRGVRFTYYRPYYTYYTTGTDYSYQDDNGYSKNTTYWFRWEPLQWRVLDPAAGLVLCETIIDSQAYSNTIYFYNSKYYQDAAHTTYANNYEKSSIRMWLNGEFFDSAFTPSQKDLISVTHLDNSAYSTSYSQYNSAATDDKIFLLSYADSLNSAYGFSTSALTADTARRAQGSDYAKCQGLGVTYAGNAHWRLRTAGSNSTSASLVSDDYKSHKDGVDYHTGCGIRPALRINPQSEILQSSTVELDIFPCPHEKTKVSARPATCTEDGCIEHYVCTICGKHFADEAGTIRLTDDEWQTPAGHTWNDGEITTDAACLTDGVKTFTCTACGETRTETIPATGHQPVTVPGKAATCAKTGLTDGEACAVCGEVLKAQAEIPATGAHTWDGGKVTTAATCSAKGVRTMICTVCKTTKNEEIAIDKNNHTGGTEVRGTKVENCGTDGYTGDTYCKDCGAKLTAGTSIPATGSHTWDRGKVTTVATCKATGLKTYTCTVCGATKTESIAKDANNHAGGIEIRNAKEASCTAAGYTGDTYCCGCGVKLSEGTSIPVISHTPKTVGGSAATCTKTGKTEGTVCAVCGETLKAQTEIPALGHTEPDADGKCTRCGEQLVVYAEYKVIYNANGGVGTPSAQTKNETKTLTLSDSKPTKSFTISFNAAGGSVSPASKTVNCTFKNWNTKKDGSGTSYKPGAIYTSNADLTLYAQWKNPTAGELPAPKRTDYTFDGWYTAASGGSKVTSSTTISANTTVYAHWTEVPKQTCTVTYNANGGTGTPSSQTKIEGQTLTLSTSKPTKTYTLSYNAAGGSVNPASKSVSCAFSGWNSKKDGSGTKYNPGGSYTADADVTLYAQWQNPTAGDLPTPKRADYTFDGWYTSASGGSKVTSSTTISANTTVYAQWTSKTAANIYNLGDETYHFGNYGDSDSPGGHCFGMSMTSSAYYLGLLDMSRLGGGSGANLYSFSKTQKVKDPICLYQSIQGSYSSSAIVAGGSSYLSLFADIDSDWKSVVAYVKNHQYDNKGSLQIGFRKNGEGGHAINFLRYENVNGQDRIYAYDNNFPNAETYFYRDSSGRVLQAPVQTFSGAIDCIALRDVSKYFSVAKKFDSTHAVYVAKDCAKITGLTYTYMEGEIDGREYVMYEIPADMSKVTIVPSEDNADFIYLGTEYSFGNIEDDTYGVLKLQSMNEGAVIQEASFQIFSGSTEPPTDPQPAALRGDANLDGKVLANDARLVLRASAKLETLEGQAFVNCDLNGDGKLLAGEARKILRYSAKLETEL